MDASVSLRRKETDAAADGVQLVSWRWLAPRPAVSACDTVDASSQMCGRATSRCVKNAGSERSMREKKLIAYAITSGI
jgi:hypothetical protein